jgi:hypothetical protein
MRLGFRSGAMGRGDGEGLVGVICILAHWITGRGRFRWLLGGNPWGGISVI